MPRTPSVTRILPAQRSPWRRTVGVMEMRSQVAKGQNEVEEADEGMEDEEVGEWA